MSAVRGEATDFVATAISTESDDCITWPYARDRDGYAILNVKNHFSGYVHRHVCFKVNGLPPTPEHEAAHNCDNSGCINKRHLRWATHVENEADKVARGRVVWGAAHRLSKLQDGEVMFIRSALNGGARQRTLALIFDVSQSLISRIQNGSAWRNLV